jgi:hypothetical protein
MFTYPLDQPSIEGQGFRYAENAAPGNAIWMTLPAEAPMRTAKGDLGLEHIKDFESRPLETAGLPFILK